jgi:hypothetical protein
VLSDWDRFARGEYLRLAVEEEPDDMQVGVPAALGVLGVCLCNVCAHVWAWAAHLCVSCRRWTRLFFSLTHTHTRTHTHTYYTQVDASEEMWGGGRAGNGSTGVGGGATKMLLEDADVDDLVGCLDASAAAAAAAGAGGGGLGGPADLLAAAAAAAAGGGDAAAGGGAAAMDASS